MLGYISSRLSKKEVINYYYNRDQKKKIAPKELAYSLYVLALAGTPNLPVMNYYKANPELLSLDSKYLLSIAYGLSGDRKKFVEVLLTSFSGEESVKQTGGSFYSPTRDEAIALNALLDLDPSNQQVNQMAAHVAQRLRNAGSLNTQECAFGVLALGKIAARSG
ncbi:MAG TPA: hypothetical protein VK628_00990, partial [Flavitalea sp.]|nr:hypothetical protein [Flavitalea sp.]